MEGRLPDYPPEPDTPEHALEIWNAIKPLRYTCLYRPQTACR